LLVLNLYDYELAITKRLIDIAPEIYNHFSTSSVKVIWIESQQCRNIEVPRMMY
jgi:hypothetical protein